jgi:hypothetical protein
LACDHSPDAVGRARDKREFTGEIFHAQLRYLPGLGDTQKQVSQFPVRHCERSEAIQGPQYDRLGCWRRACCGLWIASSQGLLAMTDGSPLTRSIR